MNIIIKERVPLWIYDDMIKKAPLWLCEINEDDGKITYYSIIKVKSAFMATHNMDNNCL